jgi:hypothetical protein
MAVIANKMGDAAQIFEGVLSRFGFTNGHLGEYLGDRT